MLDAKELYIGTFSTKNRDRMSIVVERGEINKRFADDKDALRIYVNVNNRDKGKWAGEPDNNEKSIDKIITGIFAKFAKDEGISVSDFINQWMFDAPNRGKPAQLEHNILTQLRRIEMPKGMIARIS